MYLHGGPGESCLTYSYQARELGKNFHVISFDQYGVFRSDAISETESAGVFFHVGLIEKIRIALDIKSWIPLGHSFGGMLALIYAHSYPDSTDAVIYDCPMWSALYTARAIALAAKPYYEQNEMDAQLELVSEILKDAISPKEAFMKAMTIEFSNGLDRFVMSSKRTDIIHISTIIFLTLKYRMNVGVNSFLSDKRFLKQKIFMVTICNICVILINRNY